MKLGQFGASSLKPLESLSQSLASFAALTLAWHRLFRLVASHRWLLENIVIPDAQEISLYHPGSAVPLVTRTWNSSKGRFDVTGIRPNLRASQSYPLPFGESVVPLVSA